MKSIDRTVALFENSYNNAVLRRDTLRQQVEENPDKVYLLPFLDSAETRVLRAHRHLKDMKTLKWQTSQKVVR